MCRRADTSTIGQENCVSEHHSNLLCAELRVVCICHWNDTAAECMSRMSMCGARQFRAKNRDFYNRFHHACNTVLLSPDQSRDDWMELHDTTQAITCWSGEMKSISLMTVIVIMNDRVMSGGGGGRRGETWEQPLPHTRVWVDEVNDDVVAHVFSSHVYRSSFISRSATSLWETAAI